MSDQRVTIEIAAGVADVRLNRPDKLNALDPEMFSAIRAAAAALSTDPSVRAVVLSGEGRGFCAGLDFRSFQAMSEARRRSSDANANANANDAPAADLLSRDAGAQANAAQSVAWAWQEVPVPVIAAVHGVAFGGGLQIALGADIRFVAPDARLSIMEARWGLVPDMAGTQLLRRLARLDVVKELTFTARIVSGAEAVELGLATHLSDDPRQAALALAREIAAQSPDAVRAAKALLNQSVQLDVAAGLALEASTQAGLIGGVNQLEAVQANLEKRSPHFQDAQRRDTQRQDA